MNGEKYIGWTFIKQRSQSRSWIPGAVSNGVHPRNTSNHETQAATILEFFAGLRGTLWVTFEEGTWAVWLYDLLKPQRFPNQYAKCLLNLLPHRRT
jgi:hypothetical protein